MSTAADTFTQALTAASEAGQVLDVSNLDAKTGLGWVLRPTSEGLYTIEGFPNLASNNAAAYGRAAALLGPDYAHIYDNFIAENGNIRKPRAVAKPKSPAKAKSPAKSPRKSPAKTAGAKAKAKSPRKPRAKSPAKAKAVATKAKSPRKSPGAKAKPRATKAKAAGAKTKSPRKPRAKSPAKARAVKAHTREEVLAKIQTKLAQARANGEVLDVSKFNPTSGAGLTIRKALTAKSTRKWVAAHPEIVSDNHHAYAAAVALLGLGSLADTYRAEHGAAHRTRSPRGAAKKRTPKGLGKAVVAETIHHLTSAAHIPAGQIYRRPALDLAVKGPHSPRKRTARRSSSGGVPLVPVVAGSRLASPPRIVGL